MSQLRVFNSEEFGQVRTVTINNEPWMVAKDICDALGYSNSRKAIIDHVDLEDKGVTNCDTLGGNQQMTIINESGMYALVFGSKLESAKRFKKWVTSEVLPSIRKQGTYSVNTSALSQLDLIQNQAILEVREKVDDVKQELETFKEELPLLALDCDKITTAIRTHGVDILGGKQSEAYKDKSLRSKLYSDIHMQLRREFGVTTFKALKRNQVDLAIKLVEKYNAPYVLKEEINSVNGQLAFV